MYKHTIQCVWVDVCTFARTYTHTPTHPYIHTQHLIIILGICFLLTTFTEVCLRTNKICVSPLPRVSLRPGFGPVDQLVAHPYPHMCAPVLTRLKAASYTRWAGEHAKSTQHLHI